MFDGAFRAALKDRYVRPQITNSREGRISIHDGRHPMVEHALKREMFVPNDTELNHTDQEMIIITGPNMAGKSTYMRQVAVLTIMAQTGSFIPAKVHHLHLWTAYLHEWVRLMTFLRDRVHLWWK